MNTYVKNGLTALGDPTRLVIFEMIGLHPRPVNELAARLPVSRPAVSQHLRVLKQARLVRDKRQGTRRIYELDPGGLALLRDHFSELWDKALAAFQNAAEDAYKKEKQYGSSNNAERGGKANASRRGTH